jgi:hypothetical protein
MPIRDPVIQWRQLKPTCYVAEVGDMLVAIIERPQHQGDALPADWRIEVLGVRTTDKMFLPLDPKSLESAQQSAERRVRWAVSCLHEALNVVRKKKSVRPPKKE